MKKLTALLLCMVLLFSGCAVPSASDTAAMAQPVRFYYPYASLAEQPFDSGAIGWELRDLGTAPLPVKEILEIYLQGPQQEDLVSPFPDDISIVYAALSDGRLTIRTNEAIKSLTGVSRSLAVACLVYTMTQFSTISSVQLLAGDQTLSGGWSGPWTQEDFVLTDDATTNDATTVRVYTADEKGRYLLEQSRSEIMDPGISMAEFAIRQLILASEDSQFHSALPQGTKLLQIQTSDGLCDVNFSEEFVKYAPKNYIKARLAVYAVVNTLTELPSVERVRIFCNGQSISDYAGLDLSQSLYRDESTILQDQDNTEDITLYLPCSGQSKLVGIPTQVHRNRSRALVSDVLRALLQLSAPAGCTNPFPEGSQVLGSSVRDGFCNVTLSEDFIRCDDDPEQAMLAIRSLVTTLCALPGVEQVKLTIRNGTLKTVDLSEPLSADPQWVLP